VSPGVYYVVCSSEFNLGLDNIKPAVRNLCRIYQNQNEFAISEPNHLCAAAADILSKEEILEREAEKSMLLNIRATCRPLGIKAACFISFMKD
jgi:hypothetical protein